MLALLAALFCLFAPDADIDGDGYGACEERANHCSPFNAASFPVCVDLDGDGIGETTPIAPICEIYTEGLAPCG